MRLSSAQKLILTTVLAALVAGVSIFGYMRLYQKVWDFSAKLRELETSIRKFEEERRAARAFKILAEKRDKDLERIDKFWVDRGRPIAFIEDLEKLAENTQTTMVLDFEENKSKGNELFFRLTVNGSEKNVRKFLRALEFIAYEIKIDALSFQRISERELSAVIPTRSLGNATHRLIVSLNVKAK